MNNIKKLILDSIFMLNRLALFTLYAFGIDSVSKITTIPWQIIFIATLLLFTCDLNSCKEKRKNFLKNKISAFVEKNGENLSTLQIAELNSWWQ